MLGTFAAIMGDTVSYNYEPGHAKMCLSVLQIIQENGV